MKLVYRWDAQLIYSGTDYVADDYQLASNETFDPLPQPNLMPVKRVGNAWQSATPEEFAAYVKAQQAKYPDRNQQQGPTDQDKMNAMTSLQLAQLLADSKKQDKLNAQLTIDLATVKAELQKNKAQATA